MSDTTNQTLDDAADATIKQGDGTAYAHLRRSVFSFIVTGISLAGIILIGRAGTGTVAEHAVDGLSSVATYTVMTYVGISTIDRSNILTHIGQRLRFGPQPGGQ